MLLIAIAVVSALAKLGIDKSNQNAVSYMRKSLGVINHLHRVCLDIFGIGAGNLAGRDANKIA